MRIAVLRLGNVLAIIGGRAERVTDAVKHMLLYTSGRSLDILGDVLLLGSTLRLLGELLEIRIGRNVIREHLGILIGERSHRVHDAEHGCYRRFIADGTRCVGKHIDVRELNDRIGESDECKYDRKDPKCELRSLRDGKHVNDCSYGRQNHSIGKRPVDKGHIRAKARMRCKISTRRIIVSDHDNRAIARGSDGAGSLVIGDDVLRRATSPKERQCRMS